ncbi:MAG: alcohol dehydrogenase catalytic domain-containing protein [Phormidesmis sp.]
MEQYLQEVVVNEFGGPEQLENQVSAPLSPQTGEVVINLKSIGMNQADLMARRGEYRLSSGDPPFTPGIEGGGVISAVGEGVVNRHVGQRVTLTISAPAGRGTYRSQFLALAEETIPVPDEIDDALIGALWLPFLTAWGALVWRQNETKGQTVMLPAASSSVAIAASQIAKHHGCTTIGITTSPNKVALLEQIDAAQYDHIIVTRQADNRTPWWRKVKQITQGKGVDVIFDPVAAGNFLTPRFVY